MDDNPQAEIKHCNDFFNTGNLFQLSRISFSWKSVKWEAISVVNPLFQKMFFDLSRQHYFYVFISKEPIEKE